jgi:hypothetical protein
MVLNAIDEPVQIFTEQRILPGVSAVKIQIFRVIVVISITGRGISSVGNMHYRVHAKERDLVHIGIFPENFPVYQFLTGYYDMPCGLGLLHVGKGKSLNPHSAGPVGLLHMDNRDIRPDGRDQDDLIRPAQFSEGVGNDAQLPVRQFRIMLPFIL